MHKNSSPGFKKSPKKEKCRKHRGVSHILIHVYSLTKNLFSFSATNCLTYKVIYTSQVMLSGLNKCLDFLANTGNYCFTSVRIAFQYFNHVFTYLLFSFFFVFLYLEFYWVNCVQILQVTPIEKVANFNQKTVFECIYFHLNLRSLSSSGRNVRKQIVM